jgi:hypothetical protein
MPDTITQNYGPSKRNLWPPAFSAEELNCPTADTCIPWLLDVTMDTLTDSKSGLYRTYVAHLKRMKFLFKHREARRTTQLESQCGTTPFSLIAWATRSFRQYTDNLYIYIWNGEKLNFCHKWVHPILALNISIANTIHWAGTVQMMVDYHSDTVIVLPLLQFCVWR